MQEYAPEKEVLVLATAAGDDNCITVLQMFVDINDHNVYNLIISSRLKQAGGFQQDASEQTDIRTAEYRRHSDNPTVKDGRHYHDMQESTKMFNDEKKIKTF